MSFSESGVKLHTKRRGGAAFAFLMRAAEAILSIVFVITLAAPMVFPNHASAALGVSNKLSYQGRLTDTNGNPLTGTYCIRFSVYDAASAGNKLWPSGTPASNSVTVSNGVFNVGVGDVDTLDFDFSSNDTTYLNVEVNATVTTCSGSWEALSPRQRLDAVAYARVAAGVYGPALIATSTKVQVGAGSGGPTPVWFNLDNKNTASTLGGACPSGSVNGSLWYNSSGTRALACLNNVIVAIDNTNEITNLNITGNTAGTPAAISTGAVSFAGGNNITLSQNANAITISGPSPVMGLGISNIGNTVGTSGTGTGTIVFAGGDNITLSQSTAAGARTITISAGAGGGGLAGIGASNTTYTSGTVIFSGLANITINSSVNGASQYVQISAPNPGGGGGATISSFEPYPFQGTGTGAISLSSNTSAAQMMFPFFVPQNVAAEYLAIPVSMSFITSTNTINQSGTLQWGLFTRPTGTNSTRLSNAGSGSFSYAVTAQSVTITVNQPTSTNSTGYGYGLTNSAGVNITSGYTGLKQINLFIGSTLTPGQYWLGLHHRNSTAGTNAGIRMSLYGNSLTLSGLAPIGSFSSAYSTGTNIPLNQGGHWLLGNASYTVAGLTQLTTDVTMSQMTQNLTVRPYMKFATRL